MAAIDFVRSRWLPYLVVATILGSISPMVTGLFDFDDPAARQGLLYWWFMGIPVEFDIALWPSQEYRYLLWSAVFTLQYLLVFAAGAAVVLLIQRRHAPARRPLTVPPERERAFEEAAALYHLRDSA